MSKHPKPLWVLFDYGETLIHETEYDGKAGRAALLAHATKKPEGFTVEDFEQANRRFRQEMGWQDEDTRLSHPPLEVHQHLYQRFLNEFVGVELGLDDHETERLLWDTAAPGTPMPGIEEVLERLHRLGVRTGVVSNLSFTAAALAERIHRLLPQNHFEFILPSSECVFRKPSPIFFEYALKRAGAAPRDAWFCGDNFRCDIEGAAGVGMYPVWLKEAKAPPHPANFDYLHLNRWDDFDPILAAWESE